jgi:hypothetical protein
VDAGDIRLMLLSALCGFIGTVFLINAYRIGDSSRITLFAYSGLIPKMLLGFIIWNDIPKKNLVRSINYYWMWIISI